jgi:hypothetical protein
MERFKCESRLILNPSFEQRAMEISIHHHYHTPYSDRSLSSEVVDFIQERMAKCIEQISLKYYLGTPNLKMDMTFLLSILAYNFDSRCANVNSIANIEFQASSEGAKYFTKLDRYHHLRIKEGDGHE